MNPSRCFHPVFRAACLGFLSLAAGCAAVPGPVTDELPAKVETVDDHTTAAADRNRQERENKELDAYRAEQKRREEEEAEARRRAEAEAVKVTRLDELQKQKEAGEARARAEAAERDRAAAEAKQRVARARERAGGSKSAAAVDPAARLAQRRADPRWTRPGFSGLLCAARADRDQAAGRLAAEKKKGKRADPARLADATRRQDEAGARAQKARAELTRLGLAPLGCKDQRTAEVAACFRAADAGKPCKKGLSYVEVVRSFPGG